MLRFIGLISAISAISAIVLAAGACTSRPGGSAQGSGGSAGSVGPAGSAGSVSPAGSPGGGSQAGAAVARPRPANTLELVQQASPANTQVAKAELTVPGIELFSVTENQAAADDAAAPARLVGVTGGVGGKVLESRELVRAVIEARPDGKTLARVALAVAGDDSQLLDAPQTREQKQARVGPPAASQGALVFWLWTTDVPRMVERARLDLTTGALEIEPPKVPHEVAISNAITTLGSVNVSRHGVAIKTLAMSCAEPRPRQALLAALGNHPRVKTRIAVADEAHRCGAAAVDALMTAMEQDKAAQVRAQAASALGRIGDDRARPALAKAARGEDANLAWAAKNALGKLK
jgi:hypothetical protein